MKYALCVGINDYPGAELSGCINDAMDWGVALRARGFQVAHLLDGEATLDGIREALRKLVALGRYRDRLVFTYSGHGTYSRDLSGDEADHRDEAICPADCFTRGMLYDDEIASILGNRRFGVRTTMLMDSCHSGTVQKFLDASVPHTAKRKFLPPMAMPSRRKQLEHRRSMISYGTVLLSGCKDDEYSYDAWFGEKANGAFTRMALDALATNPKNYTAWHKAIRLALPNDSYPQTPLLQGSAYKKSWAPLI